MKHYRGNFRKISSLGRLAARKQYRSQPGSRNASSNESFPAYDQNLKALRAEERGGKPMGCLGVSDARLEKRKAGWT